jgi:hypothetical protein
MKTSLPLFELLEKDRELCWNDECQSTFDVIKKNISSSLVLRGPNWTLLSTSQLIH